MSHIIFMIIIYIYIYIYDPYKAGTQSKRLCNPLLVGEPPVEKRWCEQCAMECALLEWLHTVCNNLSNPSKQDLTTAIFQLGGCSSEENQVGLASQPLHFLLLNRFCSFFFLFFWIGCFPTCPPPLSPWMISEVSAASRKHIIFSGTLLNPDTLNCCPQAGALGLWYCRQTLKNIYMFF